ncbi:hypothetical protein C8R43DRAFT_1109764 [Mycena crocata]|nr:hypothetical protein C8R43DRAFT_1109764 [Mycena crocata]
MAASPSKHSAAEQHFLDGLSNGQLKNFRDYMFSTAYIKDNATQFLDHEWIDIPTLKGYLCRNYPVAAVTPSTRVSPSPLVKIEDSAPVLRAPTLPTASVKTEASVPSISSVSSATARVRICCEHGREVVELLSDSDADDGDSDIQEISEALTRGASRSSSPPRGMLDLDEPGDTSPASGSPQRIDFNEFGDPSPDSPRPGSGQSTDSEDFDCDDLVESRTKWQDPITSYVRTGDFRITRKLHNIRNIEYVDELASVYPVHHEPTVLVVDLSDPKFDLQDPKSGELYTPDFLITNADNDSWENCGTGTGSSKAMVTFVPGEPQIQCRRAQYRCRGAFGCELIDQSLLSGKRYELDPASRNAIIAAQADTRRNDGTTPEQRAAMFKQVVTNARCTAIDSNGNRCKGAPMMKPKPGGQSRGHTYFIACSGWTPKFKENHVNHSIPDNVDENCLAQAFAGQLAEGTEHDTQPCSRLVSSGLRKRSCPHAHIVNGAPKRAAIRQYPCPATRTIYVPTDRSVRKALIFHNDTGHTHPLPVLDKVSIAVKEIYRKCVEARGAVGATVAKVDNAQSTKLLLDGKTPAAFLPALASKRVKREIVHKVKTAHFPSGLGLAGAFELYLNHLTKPLPERYIHSYLTTKDGGICILTFVPFLLKLLDDSGVIAFDDDTTYKRVEGEMNEWELTLFVQAVLRAASVVRAYINRASTDFFELIFDELQRIKLEVTGKPIALKRFVPDGNLLVMNVDMDGAQVIGICRSVMKHNVPEYSGIPNDTPPEQIAPLFIKVCWRHGKEPVNEFRSLVTPAQHERLSDFVYLDSKEALIEYTRFVNSLGIKKIKDWWDHKGMHAWIIPCLVKSQSPLGADVWDRTPSTTNTNEGQHHWTNTLTGIKLTCVEAIESARVVDQNTASEIETSMQTGILTNVNNDVANRMARSMQRQSAVARKSRESRAQSEAEKRITAELVEINDNQQKFKARSKDLNAQLKAVKGSSKKGKSTSAAILTVNSSGRVKSAPSRKKKVRPAPVEMSDMQEGGTEMANLQPDALSLNAPESQGTVTEMASVQPDVLTRNTSELQEQNSIQPDDVLAAWFQTVSGSSTDDAPQLELQTASTFNQYGTVDPNSYAPVFMNSAPNYGLDPEFYAAAFMTPAPQHSDQFPSSGSTWTDGVYNFTEADLAAYLGLGSDSSSGSMSEIPFATSSQYIADDVAFNFDASLPALPPPPADSPPELSSEPPCASTPPQSRRTRLDGLEPANILAEGTSRSRGATSRKRDAEQQESNQAKKRKTRRN